VLQQLKHYVFPANPLDGRFVARLKRGAIHYGQVNSWWPVRPVQRWIRNHHFEFRYGANGAATRVCVSGGDITHLWVADEVLLERVYQLERVPFTPDLVLDCGANIGLFTLLAAKQWPRAHFICVEPHPTTFSFLCENLELNRVPGAKLQCALDAEVGLRFMESSEGNGEAVYQTLVPDVNATPVMTLRLDSLLPTRPDAKVLIKMDIEGSELRVLDSLRARLPQECFIFIELHDGDRAVRWMHRWAERNGFTFCEVRRRDEWIDGYLARTERPRGEAATRERNAGLCAVNAGGVA